MARKSKVQKEQELKKVILDYLQMNGWQIRKQYGLADAKLEENPMRLVLVTTFTEIPADAFANLTHSGVTIPVEIQKVDVKPVIVTGDVSTGAGKVENEQKPNDDQIFHHEFSDQAKAIYNIKEVIGPHSTIDDVQAKGSAKAEAFEAWKKRHKNVKIVGE